MKPNLKTSLLRKGKRVLLCTVLVLLISFQGPIKDLVTPEKPISKTVEISMFAKADYSKEIYKNSKAQVQLTISKYKNKKFEVVYNTTLVAGNLSKMPSQQNAFTQAITVDNFYQSKELLVATYTVSYESEGSVLKYDRHILIPQGKGIGELQVSI